MVRTDTSMLYRLLLHLPKIWTPPHALRQFWSHPIHDAFTPAVTCVFSCSSIVIPGVNGVPVNLFYHWHQTARDLNQFCNAQPGYQGSCKIVTTCSNITYTIMCFTVLNLSPSLIANDWAFRGFSLWLLLFQLCVAHTDFYLHKTKLMRVLFSNEYSQVHKYWHIDTIFIFLARYTTTMDLKWNEQDVL